MDSILIGEILAVCMFFGLLGFLLLGFPVAFTIGGASLLFGGLGMLFGVFDAPLLAGVVARLFDAMTSDILIAIPLFLFMGVVLQRSGIAEDLLTTMGQSFGKFPGGLGFSVALVGAMLAASTGIVGATVVTMGLISYPAMVKAGYNRGLAGGVICASGTLAQIIPPSTVLILVGSFVQNANTHAQAALGNFAATPVTIIDIFIAAIAPGLILVALYMTWVLLKALLSPQECPPILMTEEEQSTFFVRIFKAIVPPIALIAAVLGSILSGFATATESAAVGATGALILAALRARLNTDLLRFTSRSALSMSTMIFTILIGASLFALIFRGLGGESLVEEVLTSLPGGALGAVVAVLLLVFVLGFFIDTFEIIFIVVPVFAPVLLKIGVDPIWLAVLFGLILQTSYLTPPFGFAIFYLKGAVKDLPTAEVYKGIVPFLLLQLFAVTLVLFFPSIIVWIPSLLK